MTRDQFMLLSEAEQNKILKKALMDIVDGCDALDLMDMTGLECERVNEIWEVVAAIAPGANRAIN